MSIRKLHRSLRACAQATFLVCSLSLGSFWPGAATPDASSASAAARVVAENNAGVRAHNQGQFDKAVEHLRAARALDAADPTIRLNLVRALNARASQAAEADDHTAAEKDLLAALEVAPSDEPTLRHLAIFLNNLAVAAMRDHQHEQACAFYDRIRDYLPQLQDKAAIGQIRANYSNLLTAEGDAHAAAQRVDQARAQYTQALTQNAANADALAALGDLDYAADRYRAALGWYEKALAAAPADRADFVQAVREMTAMLRKEMSIEAGFQQIEDRLGRFRLYFPRNLPNATVANILETLHEAHKKVGRDFEFFSTQPITVKIYSREQLGAIQELPQWVAGLYDGKLRLIDEHLMSSPEQLRRSLFHEYTHAVIHLMGGEAVPSWLHEGLAQVEEPNLQATPHDIRFMAERVRGDEAMTLDEITRPFQRQQQADQMPLIYLQSRLLADYLLERQGWDGVRRLLIETKRHNDFAEAFEAVFRTKLTQLEPAWKKWLFRREARKAPTRQS